jgi:hypothetical protein
MCCGKTPCDGSGRRAEYEAAADRQQLAVREVLDRMSGEERRHRQVRLGMAQAFGTPREVWESSTFATLRRGHRAMLPRLASELTCAFDVAHRGGTNDEMFACQTGDAVSVDVGDIATALHRAFR